MKQFDTDSINARLIKTLSNLSGWTQVITDSGVTSTTNAVSEMEAEAVRYLEYLLLEAKWSKAQNLSSLLAQTPFVGYLPHRKISSINTDGFVISHDARLQSAGVANIFSLADLTTAHLSPYAGTPFKIPLGTIVSSTGAVQFVTTKDVFYPDTTNGSLYALAPIVQGVKKNIVVTVLGNPYEQITINDIDANGITQVESATNVYSSQFFTVSVTAAGSNIAVPYTQIEDIFLSSNTDTTFDVSVANDFSSITLRFGNGVTGVQLTPGATVTISYLQTLGTLGIVNQNFTITSISSSGFPTTLYCTNFTAALGGQDTESIESIRGAAPQAYITNGGSVVTTSEYIKAIETLPYILLATVYSGTYIDPVTGTQQGSVLYSSIKTDGTAPDLTQLNIDVLNALSGKINPLDFSAPVAPAFLHLKLNIQGKIASTNTNLPALISQINGDLFKKYGTISQHFAVPVVNTTPLEFEGLFDNSALVSYVSNTYGLSNVTNQTEAVVDLLPSTFVADGALANYYYASFSFDPSFVRLKGFGDGVLHALKINIFFHCAECQYNNNSFSRTLFVVQQPNTNNASSIVFSFLSAPNTGTITLCGNPITLAAGDIVSTATVASRIFTAWQTLVANSGTSGISMTATTNGSPFTLTINNTGTGDGTVIINGTTINITGVQRSTTTTIAAAIAVINIPSLTATYSGGNTITYTNNYAVSIDSSNPGVLSVVPINSVVTPPTINMGTTNITATLNPTVKWVMLQYPYIANITDYNFMQNFALKNGASPAPIAPSDITTPYIPFVLVFDYTSLNPVNLTASSLGTGTLKIPQFLPVGNGNYINFAANLGSALDAKITVQVIAQPFVSDITPAAKNNIIEILPSPGTVTGQANLTPDITTQVTYAL